MGYDNLEVAYADGIGELVLRRPERRNAMTAAMGEDIGRAVASLGAQEGLRAVIVRGAGKSFSAGGDLAMLEERTRCRGDDNRRAMRRFYASYLVIRELPVPTIAAIHGHAIGAGLCFALACDLRLAARGAELGMTFARLGLHPGMGATYFLPRVVGPARAAELMLTGRVFDAEHARDIGLVSEVVAEDELLARARQLAREIAACAPVAVAQLTQTLRHGGARTLDDALDREALCQSLDYATDDMQEAIAALRAKRPPAFRGR
jgi:enoyl-CoA hydratase